MPEWAGKRVLVTGAAGFLGANLTRRLVTEGAEVHIVTRETTARWRLGGIEARLTDHRADLQDLERLQAVVDKASPQVVFHSAARSGHPDDAPGRLAAIGDSITATVTLLEALRPHGIERFVHIGSSLEYGERAAAMAESDRLEPSTFRGATKAAAALFALQAAREGRPVTVVRPFSVYGCWEAGPRLVPTLMLALVRGLPMRLTAPGYRRDFVYVDDVVDACLRAARAPSAVGEVINAGSGREWSNEEVVAMAESVSGRRLRRAEGEFPNRPADAHHWIADVAKAERLLGWRARHDLREGLARTLAWFRKHQGLYADTTGSA